jgi:cytochrome bd-type quinol oxidase subunit 2
VAREENRQNRRAGLGARLAAAALGLAGASWPASALAQKMSDEEALATCGACGGTLLFLVVAVIVINVAILVWVAKDSKARGMGSSLGWMVLVLFTGVIGLIIYLLARPKGEMVLCDNCHNKKLKYLRQCPSCGAESQNNRTSG